MVVDHTFHFNHVRLIFNLLVVQGYIDPWHCIAHVLHCFSLLNIVDNSYFIIYVGEISVPMVSFTTPTLHRCMSWHFPTHFSLPGICKRWLFLRTVSEKGWLSSLLPLIHIEFIFVFPGLSENRLLSLLLI